VLCSIRHCCAQWYAYRQEQFLQLTVGLGFVLDLGFPFCVFLPFSFCVVGVVLVLVPSAKRSARKNYLFCVKRDVKIKP